MVRLYLNDNNDQKIQEHYQQLQQMKADDLWQVLMQWDVWYIGDMELEMLYIAKIIACMLQEEQKIVSHAQWFITNQSPIFLDPTEVLNHKWVYYLVDAHNTELEYRYIIKPIENPIHYKDHTSDMCVILLSIDCVDRAYEIRITDIKPIGTSIDTNHLVGNGDRYIKNQTPEIYKSLAGEFMGNETVRDHFDVFLVWVENPYEQ